MSKKHETKKAAHSSPTPPLSSPDDGKTSEPHSPSKGTTNQSRFSHSLGQHLFDLAKHYLEHHLKLTALLIVACMVIGIIAVIVMRPPHLRVRTEHFTLELGTEIGTIRLDPSKETASAAGLVDGLHARHYTDRRAGFVLSLNKPEDWSDWSIVQAESTVDQNGRPVKAFRFFPGQLAPIPIEIRTNDGVVAFLNTKKFRNAKATLFVFQLPDRTGPVEDFIEEELHKGLRFGTVWVAYQLAFKMAHPSAKTLEASPGPPEDVKLSKSVVAPDHMNALLLLKAPHRMYGDIVGRVVVGPKGTYFIVAIRIDPTTPEDERINRDLRTMLESFQVRLVVIDDR